MESCVTVRKRGKVCMDYVERIMYNESDWGRNLEGDAAESPVVCVSRCWV